MFDGLGSGEIALLMAAALTAGLVRGFAGFGTAMIYLPVAGQILSPFAALTTLVVIELTGPLPIVPRALRDGHPADVLRLGAGLVLAMPIGVYTLTLVAPEVFRYGVSLAALLLLVCLISGLRYRDTLTPPMVYGTGAMGGFLAGSVGLPGPPVILLYMASPLPVSAVRANNHLYLILADVVMLVTLWAFDRLVPGVLLLGVLLILPYMAGNLIGARLFRPEQERTYRRVAYLLIAASALSGLPLWD